MLAVLTDTSQTGEMLPTPYGDSDPIRRWQSGLLVCPQAADPRATVHALQALGARQLCLCESVGALSPLLEPGDWLVPDDYIDGTRGQHYTYFSDKAGGYVQQVPPFDPALREALLGALQIDTPRPFKRGVYVCVSRTRLETPAEAVFWSRAGGHVVGRLLSPYLPLARELALDVAVVGIVTRPAGQPGAAADFTRYESLMQHITANGKKT